MSGAPDSAADAIIDLYERHAAEWAHDRGKILIEREWLDRLIAGLPVGSSVLDLGCGSGHPIAAYLGGRGMQVTGVDSSPSLAALFKNNLPAHTSIVADMRHLALKARFGAILAWDSFFHLRHDDQRAMFGAFQAHAEHGAMLMFTSGPGHGVAYGEYRREPLFHASLDPDEYRALLKAYGFAVLAHKANDPHCGGHTVWLARKA